MIACVCALGGCRQRFEGRDHEEMFMAWASHVYDDHLQNAWQLRHRPIVLHEQMTLAVLGDELATVGA